MKKYIVHLDIHYVTDARDKDEAKKIAEGICASKNISRRCYEVVKISETEDNNNENTPANR